MVRKHIHWRPKGFPRIPAWCCYYRQNICLFLPVLWSFGRAMSWDLEGAIFEYNEAALPQFGKWLQLAPFIVLFHSLESWYQICIRFSSGILLRRGSGLLCGATFVIG